MRLRVPAFLLWKKPAEHSVAYRLSTLATVMCGILAVLHEEEWPWFWWIVVGATIAGFALSYVRREHSNWVLKIGLSLLMMAALYDFVINLVYNPYDPRVPLANLLLWLQTLHSFDLPARRDLNYSLMVGFILVNVAAVLSHDMSFVPFLVAFLVCSLLTLQYNYVSQASEGARVHGGAVPFRVLAGQGARLLVALLLLGSVTFLFIPRWDNMRIRALPISFNLQFPKWGDGSVRNPGYPETQGRVVDRHQLRRFDADNYFGFNAFVDLNLRGRLSDEITMRVRSSEETYYRGLAFNKYTGEGWEMTDEDLRRRMATSPPLFLDPEIPGSHEIVQIFYIEKEMPNIIFAAYHAAQVYFPTDTVYTDAHSGVRAPFPLQSGMVYSVISTTRQPSPGLMRRLSRRSPRPLTVRPHFAQRAVELDLELPPTVPDRVRDLARHVVQGKVGSYEKAAAIQLYLQNHYQYSLDIPPFERGKDVADEFLFNHRKGYCEQFATAMAVMCRSIGIPARLVTGYTPGTYNPFTGYYEVKCSDAHAWVEVMVETFGWVAFDPSPGYEGVPQAPRSERGRWVFGRLLDYLQKSLGLGDLGIWNWLGRLKDRGVALVMALSGRGVPGFLALAGLFAVLGGLIFWIGRGLGRTSAEGVRRLARVRWRLPVLAGLGRFLPSRAGGDEDDEVVLAWRRMVGVLERRGCAREPGQTPREFARSAVERLPEARDAIEVVTDRYVRFCFSGETPPAEWAQAARQAADSVAEAGRRKEMVTVSPVPADPPPG